MKTLKRNLKPFWYALYEGYENMTDENGLFIGEQRLKYSKPKKIYGNIAEPDGNGSIERFGTVEAYERKILIEGTNTKIDVTSGLWIDNQDVENSPPDYLVVRVAKSLNHTVLTVKKVDLS